MTIALSANTPRVSYTVSQGATQTSFAVPFVFFTGSTDLNVFVDNVARTFDASTSNTSLFTVSGGNGSTGTVTTSVTGASGGSTVVITRAIPLSRTTDFPSSGAFEISKLNTELDTVTAIQSDFNDSASRAIRLQDSDSAVSMELPLLASRKGTVLGFNATTGAAEAGPTITAVQSLADVTTAINLLGTSDVVTDLSILGTSANVTAMGHLGTSANVSAMALLGTSAVVADMALLGVSDVIADMALLADTDVIADMNTLATSDIISDLNTLATSDIVTDMNLLATSDNVTAMGILGTSANVTAMGLLGTSAVVTDMGIPGTSANVTAMGLLGTSDVVADLALLGTSDVVADLAILATSSNVTNMATLGASGVVANIATVAGISSNVTTVANNVSGVNSFAERYRVGSSDPSSNNDEGDLFYNTTDNTFKFFNGSSFVAVNVTGIDNVVEDTTPQLGGNLDVNGNSIVSTSDGNIAITPNGSGKVVLDGISYPDSDGTNGQVIQTNGSGVLSFGTIDLSSKADVASPTFTGTPAGPTASAGTNTTQLATTAFVTTAVANAEPFPSGTSMLFQQTSAPTGWTKQTTHDDKALRIVTGSVGTGGSVAFSTALGSGATVAGGSVSGSPDASSLSVSISGNISNTTLSINQIPSHSHGSGRNLESPFNQVSDDGGGTGGFTTNTGNAGGGGSHNHGHNLSGSMSGNIGVGNLAVGASTATINVNYVDFIIANKD
jgi:hypothetical protein